MLTLLKEHLNKNTSLVLNLMNYEIGLNLSTSMLIGIINEIS